MYIGNILFDEYSRIVCILNKIANNCIHLHLYPTGEKSVIRKIKEKFLNNPFIHFHSPLPPKNLLEEIQQYDFGMTPRPQDWNFINNNSVLPNKLFDYLAAGLPIAARNTLAIANFVKNNRIGFIYEDTEELVNKIKRDNSNYEIDVEKLIMENNIHHVVDLYEKVIRDKK